MSQRTPGFWHSAPGITAGREVIAPAAVKSRRVVARCGGPDRDANAALISAAPDLYDAAENALEVLVACVVSAGGCDDDKAIRDAQMMLRTAIKIAKEGR